ncbi:prepilin-type N-terminal cleavage/methylation domain-containing protein [Herbaspirillum seropedicae]|uniref:type II secretion system protein n=1 Tax=Herbaspirillum seropedicae TaxID=964 RepID=UPI001123DF62|nr:type 4 pilus major pilin [Herbaspirillum seropedicae]QDD65243.1 prepilin-type N-terminal cleavage/methylation domain-containing protein [Herbaspirillum seropedicae]
MLQSSLSVKKARSRRHAQSGFTIVELSVAVAIAGVLLVSAIALVQVVLRQSRANDTVSSVPRVMAQIDKIYSRTTSYTGLNTDTAIGFGAFDGVFNITGASPNRIAGNTFGYPTLVNIATGFDGIANSNTGYVVTFTGIPQSSCSDIVTSAAASGVRGIVVAPEVTAGTTALAPAGMTLNGISIATAGTLVRGPATGGATAVALKGPGLQGQLDVAAMTNAAACGTNNSTVSIGLVNWK